jgi:DNA-binding CsgD family transcriptional regulator
MGDSAGRSGFFGNGRARSLGPVLIFDEGTQGASWADELGRAGLRGVVAPSEDAAALMLATGSFHVAVIGVAGPERRATRRWASHGTPVIFLISAFSARTVLELSCDGELVLPTPVEPDTLLRAVELVGGADDDEIARFSRAHRLSPRETALLRLALSGRNNDEAAEALGCSRATISSFWNRVFRKTGVSGQRDVVILLHRERNHAGALRVAARRDQNDDAARARVAMRDTLVARKKD